MINCPKILLAAPTSQHKDYCWNEWRNHIKKFTYPNLHYYVVDNSQDEKYYLKIKNHFECDYVKKLDKENNQSLICRCQNMIRDKVLNEDYDFLFSLETDQFPPFNIIEHLLSFRKNIVSIPYFTGRAFESYLLEFDTEEFGINRQSKPKIIEKAFEDLNGELKTVYQPGIGCILIHRSILEKIKFRINENDKNQSHSDVYFHSDLNKLNIPVFWDTSLICEHRNGNWFRILNL